MGLKTKTLTTLNRKKTLSKQKRPFSSNKFTYLGDEKRISFVTYLRRGDLVNLDIQPMKFNMDTKCLPYSKGIKPPLKLRYPLKNDGTGRWFSPFKNGSLCSFSENDIWSFMFHRVHLPHPFFEQKTSSSVGLPTYYVTLVSASYISQLRVWRWIMVDGVDGARFSRLNRYCWWFVRNPGRTHQLRLVVYPIIYHGFFTSKRWLGMGFLNHPSTLPFKNSLRKPSRSGWKSQGFRSKVLWDSKIHDTMQKCGVYSSMHIYLAKL